MRAVGRPRLAPKISPRRMSPKSRRRSIGSRDLQLGHLRPRSVVSSGPFAAGANLARGVIHHRHAREAPRWRPAIRQQHGFVTAQTGETVTRRGGRRSRRHRRSGPSDHAQGNGAHDPSPTLPFVERRQIVRPHQPDEARSRIKAPKLGKRGGGVPRSETRLDVGDLDSRMRRELPASRHPPLHRRGPCRLERIPRRDQPPHAVQTEALHRLSRDMLMAAVRRIEGAAEQTDRLARPDVRQLVPEWARGRSGHAPKSDETPRAVNRAPNILVRA